MDTARVYGFGHSEEVVGKALKKISREKVILSTKCGIQWYVQHFKVHIGCADGPDLALCFQVVQYFHSL